MRKFYNKHFYLIHFSIILIEFIVTFLFFYYAESLALSYTGDDMSSDPAFVSAALGVTCIFFFHFTFKELYVYTRMFISDLKKSRQDLDK